MPIYGDDEDYTEIHDTNGHEVVSAPEKDAIVVQPAEESDRPSN